MKIIQLVLLMYLSSLTSLVEAGTINSVRKEGLQQKAHDTTVEVDAGAHVGVDPPGHARKELHAARAARNDLQSIEGQQARVAKEGVVVTVRQEPDGATVSHQHVLQPGSYYKMQFGLPAALVNIGTHLSDKTSIIFIVAAAIVSLAILQCSSIFTAVDDGSRTLQITIPESGSKRERRNTRERQSYSDRKQLALPAGVGQSPREGERSDNVPKKRRDEADVAPSTSKTPHQPREEAEFYSIATTMKATETDEKLDDQAEPEQERSSRRHRTRESYADRKQRASIVSAGSAMSMQPAGTIDPHTKAAAKEDDSRRQEGN